MLFGESKLARIVIPEKRIVKREIEKAPIGVGAFGLSSSPELRNQRKRSTMPSPDGTAFVVSEDEGVGAFYYFPCENEVGFALLNF